MYAKVSKKGQITIPKPIRKKLKIEKDGAVLFLVEDNEVKLKGVPGVQSEQLAGSLKKYAKKYVSLKIISNFRLENCIQLTKKYLKNSWLSQLFT